MKYLILIWTLVLTACETTPKMGSSIEEKDYSLSEIKSAIQHIAGPPREVSQNGREIISQYFSKKKDGKFNPDESLERLYAHFYILGERRPYEIRVVVFIEKKGKKGYIKTGEDRSWSIQIKEELKAQLNNSRDGRNIIDDFRSF